MPALRNRANLRPIVRYEHEYPGTPRKPPRRTRRRGRPAQPRQGNAGPQNAAVAPAAAPPAAASKAVPKGTWADLPAELRLQIYEDIGFKLIMKPIPGSQIPGDLIPASFMGLVSDSGLERVNSSIFEEVREKTQANRENETGRGGGFAVHWNCVDQIAPLLRMIRSAKETEREWIREFGGAPAPMRRYETIYLPIRNFLRRGSARQGLPTINLSFMEQKFLEDFLEKQLAYLDNDPEANPYLTICILVPRDLQQTQIPDNLVGVVSATWQWPDPRTILSKVQHTILEAGNFPVWVVVAIERDIPVAISNGFHSTIARVDPIPPLPLYPTIETQVSYSDLSGEASELEHPIFEKMRVLEAAAAAAAVDPANEDNGS